MELLLEAVGGCMAIDLVHILGRMKSGPTGLHAQVEGMRAGTHPRRFTALRLHFTISGENIAPAEVERALKLSRETYCSVMASLHPDIDVQITYELK